MSHITCHDIKVYYELNGSGFPLLFISGLGAGTWSWEQQIPFFRRDFQVITFDNRGAGQGSAPQGPYSIEQRALDTVRLLHSLQIKELFVVGLSMEGMIAQELALLLPHRIRGLVLAATHAGGNMRIPGSQEVYDRLMDNMGMSPEEIVDKNITLLMGESTRKGHPEILKAYRRQQSEIPEQAEHAFVAQQAAIQGFDAAAHLKKIKAPTLLLAGDEDRLIPMDNARCMAEHIPNSRVEIMKGAGHLLHLEQPERFNQTLLEFFQDQP